MICYDPFIVEKDGIKIPVRCGRCAACKHRKLNDWVFRLMEEERANVRSRFLTFTYDNDHVPITKNGFMTLNKVDLQGYFKRLRNCGKFSYFAVGEYGSRTYRPHYHILLFGNINEYDVQSKWVDQNGIPIGAIHFGEVQTASVGYTLKYLSKESKHRIPMFKKDDRQSEFKIQSKGIGEKWINDQTIAYVKSNLENNSLRNHAGYRIALPDYYRKKILTDIEKEIQRMYIETQVQEENERRRIQWEQIEQHDIDFETLMEHKRQGFERKFRINKDKKF